MMRQHRFSTLAFTILLAATASACDDKTDAKKADVTSEAKANNAEASKADAAKPEQKKVVEMVEYDLSSADPTWAGWVAQAPKADVKVMKDGVKGARLAGGGRDGFDLAFAPKKRDLETLKASIKKGEAASDGKVKLTFLKEEEGQLEWKSEAYGSTTWNFIQHMTVDGMDVTCQNNIMMGLTSEEALAQHKAACATLKKK